MRFVHIDRRYFASIAKLDFAVTFRWNHTKIKWNPQSRKFYVNQHSRAEVHKAIGEDYMCKHFVFNYLDLPDPCRFGGNDFDFIAKNLHIASSHLAVGDVDDGERGLKVVRRQLTRICRPCPSHPKTRSLFCMFWVYCAQLQLYRMKVFLALRNIVRMSRYVKKLKHVPSGRELQKVAGEYIALADGIIADKLVHCDIKGVHEKGDGFITKRDKYIHSTKILNVAIEAANIRKKKLLEIVKGQMQENHILSFSSVTMMGEFIVTGKQTKYEWIQEVEEAKDEEEIMQDEWRTVFRATVQKDEEKACGFCSVRYIEMLKCKGCDNVYYCSKRHQKFDWIKHRVICKLI